MMTLADAAEDLERTFGEHPWFLAVRIARDFAGPCIALESESNAIAGSFFPGGKLEWEGWRVILVQSLLASSHVRGVKL